MAVTRLYMTPRRRLDPFAPFSSLFADSAMNGVQRSAVWTPAFDIEETDGELLLTAELPGLAPEDVEIDVEDGVLSVRGEKRAQALAESDKRRYLVGERRYGSFARSFRLPRYVRADGIVAEFDNGVLRVRLPKAAEARTRKIPVSARGEAPAGEAAQ
jgi:HSP20 family protein